MSNILHADMSLAILLGASLVTGTNVAVAQDQSSSLPYEQELLAEKEGGKEMVEPAPSVGRTPVIKPEQNR